MKTLSYGQIAGAFLLLSILSGFVVAYQYEPATPFVSVVAIDAILPFGFFWRSLHFWTSQAFVVLLFLHVLDAGKEVGRGLSLPRMKWHWMLISFSAPVAIYDLFSGYVLRYDATGRAAGAVAEHLFLKIPVAGRLLDKVLMNISGDGLNRLYAVHILAGFFCWLMGTWYHTKRVRISYGAFSLALSAGVICCFLVRAPIDLPSAHAHLIKGPWFFLGIQELLRYFAPLLAGVVFPAIPIAVLLLFPWIRNSRSLYLVILLWTFAYSGVSLISLLRSAG